MGERARQEPVYQEQLPPLPLSRFLLSLSLCTVFLSSFPFCSSSFAPAMLGKRARLASAATSPPEPIQITAPHDGYWAAEAVVGLPSPLERDPRSPKGWKNREVGLRIVAALQKSGSVGDVAAKAVMSSPRFGGPSLLVASPRTADVCGGCCTGVIFGAGFGPEEKKCGGVFCGVDEEDEGWGVRWGKSGSLWSSSSLPGAVAEDFRLFPTADFLSSCYLCEKKLHGEDIYMYRGEKAFCSMECRNRQIAIDEYQENWASQLSKPPSVKPMADYSGGRLFCTGVAAA